MRLVVPSRPSHAHQRDRAAANSPLHHHHHYYFYYFRRAAHCTLHVPPFSPALARVAGERVAELDHYVESVVTPKVRRSTGNQPPHLPLS